MASASPASPRRQADGLARLLGNRRAGALQQLHAGQGAQLRAENDAQVINLSLAGPPDRLLQTLLDAALARGIAVVGAVDPGAPTAAFRPRIRA
jgi:DNA-binding transcriptional MocR family regulator